MYFGLKKLLMSLNKLSCLEVHILKNKDNIVNMIGVSSYLGLITPKYIKW